MYVEPVLTLLDTKDLTWSQKVRENVRVLLVGLRRK